VWMVKDWELGARPAAAGRGSVRDDIPCVPRQNPIRLRSLDVLLAGLVRASTIARRTGTVEFGIRREMDSFSGDDRPVHPAAPVKGCRCRVYAARRYR